MMCRIIQFVTKISNSTVTKISNSTVTKNSTAHQSPVSV